MRGGESVGRGDGEAKYGKVTWGFGARVGGADCDVFA